MPVNLVGDFIFLGNPLTNWIYAALFAGGGIACGILVSNLGALLVRALLSKKEDLHAIYKLIKRPIALFVVYGGCRLALIKLVFSDFWEQWETRALDALFTVLICWSIAKLIDALIVHLTEGKTDAAASNSSRIPLILIELQPFLRKFFSFLLILIPLSIILRILGYNISGIMAGLGIGGAALALASKDLLSSFFGAASVFIDKSFKLGDRIKVADYDGFVVDMRIRTSQIRTLENRIVTIPNSVFQNTPIENVSSEPNTKIFQVISIRARNGLEKTQKAVEILKTISFNRTDSAADAPLIALDGKSIAALSHVGIHVFKISFIYFIAKGADYWETINAVNLEVLRRFDEAGIELERL
jgi:MscS family membrane protein